MSRNGTHWRIFTNVGRIFLWSSKGSLWEWRIWWIRRPFAKFSRNSNEMVKEPFRNVAKTMNLAKIYQNRRNKLNKMTISYLFGGNGENSKNRRNLSRSPNEMAKGPLWKWGFWRKSRIWRKWWIWWKLVQALTTSLISWVTNYSLILARNFSVNL